MTGGLKTLDKVTVYNSKGWVEDLPSLKTGRYYHACGSFVTSDKKMASFELNNVILASVICTTRHSNLWDVRRGMLVDYEILGRSPNEVSASRV